MAQIDYEQAVQTLRSRLGARYEGVELDGRDEMGNVLQRELGYSAHEADEAIEAMISAGTLRYRRSEAEPDDSSVAAAPAIGAIPSAGVAGTGATSAGSAPIIPVPIGGGYWQIGAGDEEEGGRKGQVSPT